MIAFVTLSCQVKTKDYEILLKFKTDILFKSLAFSVHVPQPWKTKLNKTGLYAVVYSRGQASW